VTFARDLEQICISDRFLIVSKLSTKNMWKIEIIGKKEIKPQYLPEK